MQARDVHAEGSRRPVALPGQQGGKVHPQGATGSAPADQFYGRWTPTPCTIDSLKVLSADPTSAKRRLIHAAARFQHRFADAETPGANPFHGPSTFSQHRLEELQLFIQPRLDAMAEEAEQRRQAEEQARLHALRQQQSRFLDALRGAEAANARLASKARKRCS
ncbi:hypothetical protein WJX84_012020 [Apatococcus fuscideae]|uniref:Uncharacterized protein n=1 Tax=Apatococcus fuscideae TaxID=2026836 RepID=A0AAW1THC9_9CHLO